MIRETPETVGDIVTLTDVLTGKTNEEIEDWGVRRTWRPGGLDTLAFDIVMGTYLAMPPGTTTVGIDALFWIDVCGVSVHGGRGRVARRTVCDFGRTASIRLGEVAEGVEIFSASGQFLGLRAPGGGPDPGLIPAPGSLALALAALGGLASVRRLRPRPGRV